MNTQDAYDEAVMSLTQEQIDAVWAHIAADSLKLFEASLPDHKVTLHLTHNQHRSYYETVEQYLGDFESGPSFHTDEDRAECFASDEIWELQWYPDTPVGSYHIAAPTLTKLIAFSQVAMDD